MKMAMDSMKGNNLLGGSIGKLAAAALLCSSAAVAYAQEAATPAATPTPTQPETLAAPVEAPAVGSAYSVSLGLDFNSHFISYGADVWGTGSKWKRLIVNPSISINVDITEDFYVFTGLWMDVNSYATSNIGDKIQEVDVWIGAGYSWNGFNIELTYQEWIYGGDTERIVDIALSYDTFLNPHVIIHNRVEPNGDQSRGAVFVFGGSYDLEYEGLTISVPLDVAFATTHFHGGAGGFAYVTTGVNLSYPLSFISEAFGLWNVHGGISYYYTNNSIIPNNPTDSFVTGNFGIGLDF